MSKPKKVSMLKSSDMEYFESLSNDEIEELLATHLGGSCPIFSVLMSMCDRNDPAYRNTLMGLAVIQFLGKSDALASMLNIYTGRSGLSALSEHIDNELKERGISSSLSTAEEFDSFLDENNFQFRVLSVGDKDYSILLQRTPENRLKYHSCVEVKEFILRGVTRISQLLSATPKIR